MKIPLNIIEVRGSQAAELSLPSEWGCEDFILTGDFEHGVSLPSRIADTTQRHCPNREICEAGGFTMSIGQRLVEAAVTCQAESCPIEQ